MDAFSAIPTDDLEQLYDRFRHFAEESGTPRQTLFHELLVHPASQSRLQIACAAVKRGWTSRRDLRADVMQEATRILLSRFQSGRFVFRDLGFESFAAWIWTVWFNACNQAWRACRRQLRKQQVMENRELEELVALDCRQESQSLEEHDVWHSVTCALAQLDIIHRAAIVDWGLGLTEVQSAALQGVATSTISRRRKKALQLLRKLISDEAAPC